MGLRKLYKMEENKITFKLIIKYNVWRQKKEIEYLQKMVFLKLRIEHMEHKILEYTMTVKLLWNLEKACICRWKKYTYT